MNRKGTISIFFFMIFILLGVMLSFGASVLKQMVRAAQVKKTEKTLQSAVDTLTGYVAEYRSLPDQASFLSASGDRRDALNNTLYYMYDNDLTTADSVCGSSLTKITVRICADSGCTAVAKTTANVAFVLLSAGSNRNLQANFVNSVTTAATLDIFDQTVETDSYASDTNFVEQFDDQYKLMTIEELRNASGCAQEKLKIVNTILPGAARDEAYTVDIYADGGIPLSGGNYYWCVETDTGTLPSGLSANPSFLSTDCGGEPASSWSGKTGTKLTISGTPTTAGTAQLRIYTRDNNGTFTQNNTAEKRFLITVN